MTNKKIIRFDNDGNKILPDVKIGNERCVGMSRLGTKPMVSCDTHGTTPAVFVLHKGFFSGCCGLCIRQFCQIAQTVTRPGYTWDSDMDNPAGHSF